MSLLFRPALSIVLAVLGCVLSVAAAAPPGDVSAPAGDTTPPAGATPEGGGKGDDAVILEESVEVVIASPTSARVHVRNRTQVLTRRGVDTYDQVAIDYQPGVVVRQLRAAVIPPSGKPVEVKKQNISDRAAFESYELYSESKMRVIDFPGVVPGSILEYEYEQDIRSLVHLPLGWSLQRSVPLRSLSVTVRAPASYPLRVTGVTGAPVYSREEKDGVITHRWNVRDVPPYRREMQMPPFQDVIEWADFTPVEFLVDNLTLDTASWGGVARFQWTLYKDRVVPDPEVAATAATLTAGLTRDEDKVRALFEFAQGRINYVAVALGLGGWQPHANGDVFRHRYGDCKDKATLMIAMMRSVGLTGYPVLIRTRDSGLVQRDNPGLFFNHVIVGVPQATGYQFLDPTDESTPYGDLPWVDQGVPVLVVRDEGAGDLTETPLMAPERNRRHRQVTASIDAAGNLEGTYVIEAWGQRRVALAGLVDGTPSDRDDAIEDMIALLAPGAVMTGNEIAPPTRPEDPIRITIRFKVPRFVTQAGTLQVFTPHLARLPMLTQTAAYPGRRYPLFYHYLMSETSEVRLQLPPGRTLKKTPAGRSLEGPGLSEKSAFTIAREGDRTILVVRRDATISRREIPASDYAAFRTFVAAIAEAEAVAVTMVSDNQGG